PAWGASGIFDQSRVMVENARLSDAEEMLQQWLSSHPEDQEARFLLARVFAWQGKHAEALEQYERLLEKEPDNGDYLTGRAMLPVRARPVSPNGLPDLLSHPLGIP
ncbi:MAG: tetratricopeptide repeat protein, partial [Sulfurimicrobium sp.]|nr:tetratricopeptide repeat protein [Sulfurimicrobium sp.]